MDSTIAIKYPTFSDVRLYLLTIVFVVAGISLPALLHQFGIAGQMLLPLYLFSLLAGITYGKRCGLLVGFLGPIISFYISGMPLISILPFVLFKSVIIGLSSGILSEKFNGKNLFIISVLSVLITQILGAILIYIFSHNINLSLMDIKTGYLGLILQLTFVPYLSDLLIHGDKTLSNHFKKN